jgi:hypothetical protein
MTENSLCTDRNVLFLAETNYSDEKCEKEAQFLRSNFCGRVVVGECAELARLPPNALCFLTGDISRICDTVQLTTENTVVIRELSHAFAAAPFRVISALRVPLSVHGVGVFFRRFFFDENDDFFARVEREHAFQFLTESTHKENVALRKGIYLSEVTELQPGASDALGFHLLRCSSNLHGPTDNFRATDRVILRDVNAVLPHLFEQSVAVNHVLAQIYYNGGSGLPSPASTNEELTQKKATIKRHSDKTKDMPANGVIAFGTFYDFSKCNVSKCSVESDGDIVYRGKHSLLTEIEFVLKRPSEHPHLARDFRVTMLPNSLLVISLDTNRLFTHEIKPSLLPVERIPTRLGYVMRCSSNRAVHRNGQTFMVDENDGSETPLHAMCPEDSQLIKSLYRNENATDDRIVYGKIFSSFNEGDYLRPLL